jgi:hypothetical protein
MRRKEMRQKDSQVMREVCGVLVDMAQGLRQQSRPSHCLYAKGSVYRKTLGRLRWIGKA